MTDAEDYIKNSPLWTFVKSRNEDCPQAGIANDFVKVYIRHNEYGLLTHRLVCYQRSKRSILWRCATEYAISEVCATWNTPYAVEGFHNHVLKDLI